MEPHRAFDMGVLFRGDHALYENTYTPGAVAFAMVIHVVRTVPIPLPAGSRENQLMFSYYTIVNMAGGEVVFELPPGLENK